MGVLPAALKILGKKFEIENINEPIQHPFLTKAASATHKTIFDELNKAPEEAIKPLLTSILKSQEQPTKPAKQQQKKK
ncbi:unnamed protein product [marine sediment metagenome]|uniref:Uncharacterized protein n=1 Tax=marine sediment metagenome TaxID=412755 RepID=X1DQZ4_9ZZZZ